MDTRSVRRSRLNRECDGAKWSPCSQLIREGDVVAVRVSHGVKAADIYDVASRHVVELEKEMDT